MINIKKIHGVLPYISPEVLGGKTYTQSADIYSFGILSCEILSGLPPYHNVPHDEFLALKIYQDRKSTRLNSSHRCISYAVFCLKKKSICEHIYLTPFED